MIGHDMRYVSVRRVYERGWHASMVLLQQRGDQHAAAAAGHVQQQLPVRIL
jgi:hypothetical protein